MWCSHCQQDVPGIASVQSDVGICCARCGSDISPNSDSPSKPASNATQDVNPSQSTSTISPAAFPIVDDWELENDLQDAKALVNSVLANEAGFSQTDQGQEKTLQIPTAELNIPQWHIHQKHSLAKSPRSKKSTRNSRRRRMLFAWPILLVGVCVLVCGGVLLVWSLVTGRGDLWNIGMPLILAGHTGLVLGLILQMDGLWQTSKETSDSLDLLDDRLSDLKHTATLMSSSHSSPSQSFYTHMADGAGPQLLLADLKGQLDLLAQQMAHENR